MATKTCIACGESRPTDSFHRQAKAKDGLQPKCKPCVKAYRRQHYLANRDKQLAQMAAYRAANPERMAHLKVVWVERNRGHVNRYRQAYRKVRPDNPATRAAWRAKNAERYRLTQRMWKQVNADRVRGHTQARRSRPRGAVGSHIQADWEALCHQWGNCCSYCGATGLLTRDHVIPLSRGGSDFISNIRPACGTCNASKGAKTIMEWRTRWPASTGVIGNLAILRLSADRAV